MKTFIAVLAGALLLWSGTNVEAGKYNPTATIGDQFAGFQDLPATDGKEYDTEDFAKAKVLVIAFTCISCPYAIDYEKRFQAFHEECQKNPDVQFVAISCNLVKADSLDAIAEHCKEKDLNFPYLFDESQESAKKLGALRTPECFVFDADRKLVYMGAFDDSTDPSKIEKQYVQEAVKAALAGSLPEVQETPPIGCLIRFKRSRR